MTSDNMGTLHPDIVQSANPQLQIGRIYSNADVKTDRAFVGAPIINPLEKENAALKAENKRLHELLDRAMATTDKALSQIERANGLLERLLTPVDKP